ncbi:PREDICTED: uncharacterized protein LOC105448572 [Wasmannia auropunctata]|uniref:uncharacterized protein LOC105448572 n=1 Tax=Wasmannia auropunctata TaxID=64793 RepID=UPI0005EDE4BC|nr:PREDICTED: uncharacterized protein LOC105448572 [Wasmannia auropunctata]
MHTADLPDNGYTMLSTAVLYVYDSQGTRTECRALLDSGINGATTTSTQTVRLKLLSRLNSYSVDIECIVTERVTDRLPAFTLDRKAFDIPRNLPLADPHFHKSSDIDVLLGAEVFWDLMCVGQVRSSPKHPTLQKTRLGWILAGRMGSPPNDGRRVQSFHATISNLELHNQLSQFWQQESGGSNPTNYTLVKAHCEQHFIDNVTRDQDGRFVVKLPIKEQVMAKIGNSRDVALKRLLSLEKRFYREPDLKTRYVEFINEYLSLGHMRVLDTQLDEDSASFYLPHHGVFKTSDQSSKIRVVFDASCKSSTGISLNDALIVGPVVQQDLMSILLRFRTHRYAISADIVKMYRQVLIHPSQTRLQRILWRDNIRSGIKTYELTTVTYGTSSASYLATRCLKYLAEQHAPIFPVGSKCVERDFYVDDLLTGADTIADAKLIINETLQLLRLGSFELSKWASNSPELLENIGDRQGNSVIINDGVHPRILGAQWDQSEDTLGFCYQTDINHHTVSKRTILSEVAKLFDPLGLIGPIIVIAKLILQELWQAGCQWDESVPQAIQSRWLRLKLQLPELNKLRVSRCIKLDADSRRVQVHDFCDASQRAYGACIYLRTEGDNEYHVGLLCSKSRIAPNKTISLPRLELSAALLLAQLLDKVRNSFDLSHMGIFLWSDSTIALNWLTSPSRKWTAFVANRVGEIQRLTKIESWRHISSSNNPADILSRGLDPHELISSSLWWQGPKFLQSRQEQWPSDKFIQLRDDIPERRATTVAAANLKHSTVDELASKFSSLIKIGRILSYCLRFCKTHRPIAQTSFVSHSEIAYALNVACRAVQMGSFSEEYRALSEGKYISASSKLLSLCPFMDKLGLIRVGGD